MTTGTVAKFRRVLALLFRERQIYHRSDGVVHFIAMSGRTQIALAVLAFGFLLWVAYSSVNVVFKEQIIVAKEADYREMEWAYQGQIGDIQRAIDEANSLNLIQHQEFNASMRELTRRHDVIDAMVNRKIQIDDQLGELASSLSTGSIVNQPSKGENRIMVDSIGREPTPRLSKTPALRQSSLKARQKAASFGLRSFTLGKAGSNRDEVYFLVQDHRAQQVALLTRVEELVERRISELRAALDATGLGAKKLVAYHKNDQTLDAQGGPLLEFVDTLSISLDEEDLDDPYAQMGFNRQSLRIAERLDALNELRATIGGIPLATPLVAEQRITSHFGWREDPIIRGKRAFHPGMDIKAKWKSPIRTTAPGVISFSGVKSGYGKFVEVDHGNGFKTRYGHLNKISVKKGERVVFGDQIGLLGSTGRSTAPHVHYEIIYNGKRRNPMHFLKAGRYVFES